MSFYFVDEGMPSFCSHIVRDNRPRFKTFTLAKKFFIAYCRNTMQKAHRSAHKSFCWQYYGQAPSAISKRQVMSGEYCPTEIDITGGGAYNGRYATIKLCYFDYSKPYYSIPRGPLISTQKELEDYIQNELN